MRRFLILSLVLAACGSSTVSTDEVDGTGTAAPATPAPIETAPPPDLDPGLLAETFALETELSDVTVALLATKLGETGDERWVPFLIDLLRLAGGGESLGRINGSLETLTGIPIPADPTHGFRVYGSWMYDEGIDPGVSYIEWKATMYGLIDPEFTELLVQVEDPVLAARLQWGGVRRGGIPELNHQETWAVAEAAQLTTEELTFGAVIDGVARAYPHRILDHHELANDTLAGAPVALVNCTLCRTGILYSRLVEGRLVEFETSGLLLNSNKVMVDRQTNTLWEQVTGVGIAGEYEGVVLDRHPVTVTTWGRWIEEHPDTDVLTIPAFPGYSYEPGDAYATYYEDGVVWFPIFEVPDTFADHAEMGTLLIDDIPFAVSIAELTAAGPQALDVGARKVAAVPTGGGARFYDLTGTGDVELDSATAGETELTTTTGSYPRLQSGQSFWFAWYGNHPDTGWWPAP